MTQIIGDEALKRKLSKLGNLNFLRPTMKAVGIQVRGKAKIYPPSTIANSPSMPRWYERGYGPRWRKADGSVGGRATSETLGKRWTSRTTSNTRAVIGNNASYAPFVHDPERQASALDRIGWKTTDQIAEEEEIKVLKAIQKAVDRELAKA